MIGDSEEDVGADDGDLENPNQKQKISDSMFGWQLTLERSEEVGIPNYDTEVSHNHIPRLTNGQEVIQLAS